MNLKWYVVTIEKLIERITVLEQEMLQWNLYKKMVTHYVKLKNNLVLTIEHLVAISKQDKPILQIRLLNMRCQEKHFQIILKKI